MSFEEFTGNTQKAEMSISDARGLAKQYQPPTVRERLENQKRNLEAELATINEAIAALDQNPEVERVLTILGRAHF